jgi:hypothetical protein
VHVRVHVDDFLSAGSSKMVSDFRLALAARFKKNWRAGEDPNLVATRTLREN